MERKSSNDGVEAMLQAAASAEAQQETSAAAEEPTVVTRSNKAAEEMATSALEMLAAPPSPTPTAPKQSFLSDSLTEEERRTRTRYIPDVSGMHALRKGEVKSDLTLLRNGTTENQHFAAPPPVNPPTTATRTAYAPPPLPESTPAQTAARLQRWERRPQDRIVDCNNYTKTVERTRQELANVQATWDRRQATQPVVQGQLVQAWQWRQWEVRGLQSMTSKLLGTQFSSVLDAIEALQRLPWKEGATPDMKQPVTGLGGVSSSQWKSTAKATDTTAAVSTREGNVWLIPGNVVVTPDGSSGTVTEQCGIEQLLWKRKEVIKKEHKPRKPSEKTEDDMDIDRNEDSKSTEQAQKNGYQAKKDEEESGAVLVEVQLSDGTLKKYPLESLVTTQDPATLPNSLLVERWEKMYETAQMAAPILNDQDVRMGQRIMLSNDNEAMTDDDGEEEEIDETDNATLLRHSKLLPIGSDLLPTAYGRGNFILQADLDTLDAALEGPLYHGQGRVYGSPAIPDTLMSLEKVTDRKHRLQAEILQLRHKLQRQRRLRQWNEKTLASTRERVDRAQSLVAEMQTDLVSLQERLQDDLREMNVTEEQADGIISSFFTSLESSRSKRPRDSDEQTDDEVMASSNKR